MSLPRIRLTAHAWQQLQYRHIPETVVAMVAARPEQTIRLGSRRQIRQSIVPLEGRRYLVRVVIELVRGDTEVITVYRTSKVARYWRTE
jgi:hypothetical protein